jgi:hypothetical protein
MIAFAVTTPAIPIRFHPLQGVYPECVDGRITFYTYAVRE